MLLEMSYGKEYMTAELKDDNVLGVLLPQEQAGIENPFDAIKEAVNAPIGTNRLVDIAKEKSPSRVVIVVNDSTRPTPYKLMLPPILEELFAAGIKKEQITFVIATGSHRANTERENRDIFGDDVVDSFPIISHSCDEDLVSIGLMSDGTDLRINRQVAEADLLITTGLITLHYFAGYSGGRKSILPGVAARDIITDNHSKMTDPRACTGNYLDNPVHYIMLEAARMAGVDFMLNVVTNSKKEIVGVVAGDVEEAWIEGVKVCAQMGMVPIESQADVVIVSAGGYPKDINVYQAQKALDAAAAATRPGGTVILVADCPEGLGEHTFAQWIEESQVLEDIFTRFEQGFKLGGHKAFAIAQVLREKEVILLSSLGKEMTEDLFMTHATNLQEALAMVENKYGSAYKAYVIPQGGMVYPQIRKG